MSDGHKTATLNDYTVTYHPAFASRCVVSCDGAEHEVYRQKETHRFANGEKHPKKHRIRLQGGRFGRNVTIEVDDPDLAVHSITLELYGADHVPGAAAGSRSAETFTIMNDSETCPPVCDPIRPGG